MKWIPLLILALLTSCIAEKKQTQSAIGKYIYVSPGHFKGYCVLHIDRECASNTKTQEPAVWLIKTSELKAGGITTESLNNSVLTCPKCVDDETYQQLKALTEKEENEE